MSQFLESIDAFKFLYGNYEFYTNLVDVVEGFYLSKQTKLAQNLSEKIADQYSERMQLFSQFSQPNQLQIQDRIKKEWSAYNYFLQIVNSFDESDFFNTLENQYNKNVSLFNTEQDSLKN